MLLRLLILIALLVSIHGCDSQYDKSRCAMCTKEISPTVVYTLFKKDGKEINVCCAHCGIMLAKKLDEEIVSIKARCFASSLIVDGDTAYYLVGSELVPCCKPSIICFGKKGAAMLYQKKYHGEIYGFEDLMKMNVKEFQTIGRH